MNPVRSRYPIIGMVLAAVLSAGITVAPSRAEAQGRKPTVRAASEPADPCCEITVINARTGLVTAKNLQSGETFQFRVTDRRLLRGLKVGQDVYGAEGTGKVGLHAGEACCAIVAPAQPVDGVQPINDISLPDAAPAQPVNGIITAIDVRSGLVTARVANGVRHVGIVVTDRGLLRSLKPGQQVSVNYAASQAQVANKHLGTLSLVWVGTDVNSELPPPPSPAAVAACKEQEKQPQNAGKICLMEANHVGTGTWTWSCVCTDKNLVDDPDGKVKKEGKN